MNDKIIPCEVRKTFPGLTSRCTIFLACIKVRARAKPVKHLTSIEASKYFPGIHMYIDKKVPLVANLPAYKISAYLFGKPFDDSQQVCLSNVFHNDQHTGHTVDYLG